MKWYLALEEGPMVIGGRSEEGDGNNKMMQEPAVQEGLSFGKQEENVVVWMRHANWEAQRLPVCVVALRVPFDQAHGLGDFPESMIFQLWDDGPPPFDTSIVFWL